MIFHEYITLKCFLKGAFTLTLKLVLIKNKQTNKQYQHTEFKVKEYDVKF